MNKMVDYQTFTDIYVLFDDISIKGNAKRKNISHVPQLKYHTYLNKFVGLFHSFKEMFIPIDK